MVLATTTRNSLQRRRRARSSGALAVRLIVELESRPLAATARGPAASRLRAAELAHTVDRFCASPVT
jgi:hypothetical protein